ncbi:MAG: hypothetical protein PVI57_19585 [Gemmatimonadota bacterium]|jgi:hypothetical protein
MSGDRLADAFLDAAREAASRLEDGLGLGSPETTRVSDDTAAVSFVGPGVVLTLVCDRGEMDAMLTRAEVEDGPAFQIRLVLGLAGVEGWRTRWPRIVGSETARRSVGSLVSDILEHGGPWLRGDPDALERLEDFREVGLALKMAQFGPGRRPAGEWAPVRDAWESQALGPLADAIRGLPRPLRAVEEQAMAYAERHRPE